MRALVRDPRRAGRLATWGVELVEGDVADASSLGAACDGVDAVVHLVSIIKGSRSDFDRVMSLGTRDLVAAAREAGVRRFVLTSALGLSERSRRRRAVLRREVGDGERGQGVRARARDLRPSFVFGKDGGVLPTFIRLARLAPVTPIVGPGTQRLQPIWVEDLAQVYAQALDLPGGESRFELGGPDAPTWNEFWDRLKRVLGKSRPSLHVPVGLMRAQALLTERLPGAPVTRDQLTMLELGDNVVTDPSAADVFDVALVPLDEQLRRAAS